MKEAEVNHLRKDEDMWLDEIEDTAWREQKGDAMLIVGRMARVLRELGRGILVYRDALVSANLGANVEVHEDSIFSDDAKDLVDTTKELERLLE